MARRMAPVVALLLAVAVDCSKENSINQNTTNNYSQSVVCQGPADNNAMCEAAQNAPKDAYCVYGYCRHPCTSDAECNALVPGSICLPGADGTGCRLPEEAQCGPEKASCATGLVCASDTSCRVACSTDGHECSLVGLHCENGACMGTALGPIPDAGPDTATGDAGGASGSGGSGGIGDAATDDTSVAQDGAPADAPEGPDSCPLDIDEDISFLDDCAHSRVLGQVTENDTPMKHTSAISSDDKIDIDYFLVNTQEVSDLECTFNPTWNECFQYTVAITDPPGADYQVCIRNAGNSTSGATCDAPLNVVCSGTGADNTATLNYAGGCSKDDNLFLYIVVSPVGTQPAVCTPYDITIAVTGSGPQQAACSWDADAGDAGPEDAETAEADAD